MSWVSCTATSSQVPADSPLCPSRASCLSLTEPTSFPVHFVRLHTWAENILLTHDYHLKVCDFGTAKILANLPQEEQDKRKAYEVRRVQLDSLCWAVLCGATWCARPKLFAAPR